MSWPATIDGPNEETMDNNKTALTHRVTATAVAFLDRLGCKPVETEVPIAQGWTADVASMWSPTETEGKRLRLNDLAAATMDAKHADDWLEIAGQCRLIDRVFGPGPFAVLCEVKTSRPDFAGDRKWEVPPPAHLCFVAYPHGMIDAAAIPVGWWGLETAAGGTQLKRLVRNSGRVFAQHPGPLLAFATAVAVRRDHRTRHAALRDMDKQLRVTDREEKTQFRAARLLDNLANWLQGKGYPPGRSFDEMLKASGIKNLPKYAGDGAAYFRKLKDD